MSSLKLYILARTELQLESLNASGAIGNYTKLQEGYVVVNGEPIPVPVITGNALKNWHARAMAEKYVELTGNEKEVKVHDIHFTHMFRLPGEVIKGGMSKSTESSKTELKELELFKRAEELIVSECAICDLHGLLIAERGLPQVKRESLIKFSFGVPIQEEVRKRLKFAAVHNRVVPVVPEAQAAEGGRYSPEEETQERAVPEARGMMVFKREYSSAIYAWESVINLESIGRSQYDKDPRAGIWLGRKIVENDEERARRAKAAVLAFENLLTGSLGASASRALPISKSQEVVAILVEGSVPVPCHPYYDDYKESLKAYIKAYHDKISKIYAMNVKREEFLNNQDQIKLHEKMNEFNDCYSLLSKLAQEVYNEMKRGKLK